MIVSYGVAYSAVKDLNINWSDLGGLSVNDGIVLMSDAEKEELIEEKTVSVTGLKALTIDSISSDIHVISESRTDVYVQLKGYYKNDPGYTPPKLNITEVGNVVKIEIEHKKSILGLDRLSLDLLVIVPESYKDKVVIETTSGDIDVQSGVYTSLDIETVSGKIETLGTDAEQANIASTSGHINLRDFMGELNAETISGNLDIQLEKVTSDVEISSISGDVELSVPQTEAFGVNISSTSGKVQSDHELRIEKASDHKLIAEKGDSESMMKISTISGDVNVR